MFTGDSWLGAGVVLSGVVNILVTRRFYTEGWSRLEINVRLGRLVIKYCHKVGGCLFSVICFNFISRIIILMGLLSVSLTHFLKGEVMTANLF